MKRIFSNPVFALAAGLCLRLFFALKFPGTSGDTALYEEIATTWLKRHVYGVDVGGAITPVDIRMPGYPAFLALIYALTGRSGESARLWVMLVQIGVDLATCLVTALLAAMLLLMVNEHGKPKQVFAVALWLSAMCPFTANYVAVPLTEIFAVMLTASALACLSMLIGRSREGGFRVVKEHWALGNDYWIWAGMGAIFVGLGTLFRPETPLLLVSAAMVLAAVLLLQREIRSLVETILVLAALCLLPLAPWAIRNALTLHELQFLTPKYSTLPSELVPYGFMAWEKTWLYRVRDCYLVPWKLNEEAIDVDKIPGRAFDSLEEKQRVACILEKYNEDLILTKEEDDAFGQIARERNARHPLRTFLWIPAARAVAIWFTPRIELLPISGNVFPLAQMREEDPEDQEFTILLFLLNIIYVGLGAWGAIKLWRSRAAVRPVVAFLMLFIVLRTVFLTTLETPEPRYVLLCFPALIAMGAQVFVGKSEQPLSKPRPVHVD
jgi:hypothetical protein